MIRRDRVIQGLDEELEEVMVLCERRFCPPDLRKRLKTYLKGQNRDLKGVNLPLDEAIKIQKCMGLVRGVLRVESVGIVMGLEREVYFDGQKVDVRNRMVLLKSGRLEVLEDKVVVGVVDNGGYGELNLMFGDVQGNVLRACGDTVVYTISRQEFENIVVGDVKVFQACKEFAVKAITSGRVKIREKDGLSQFIDCTFIDHIGGVIEDVEKTIIEIRNVSPIISVMDDEILRVAIDQSSQPRPKLNQEKVDTGGDLNKRPASFKDFVISAKKFWKGIHEFSLYVMILLLPFCLGLRVASGYLPTLSAFFAVIGFIEIAFKLNTPGTLKTYLEIIFDSITAFPWVFVVDLLVTSTVTNRFARLVSIVSIIPSLIMLMYPKGTYTMQILRFYTKRFEWNRRAVRAVILLLFMALYWHFYSTLYNFLLETRAIPPINASHAFNRNFDSYSFHFWSSSNQMLNTGCGVDAPKVPLDMILRSINVIVNTTYLALFIGNISAFMVGLNR